MCVSTFHGPRDTGLVLSTSQRTCSLLGDVTAGSALYGFEFDISRAHVSKGVGTELRTERDRDAMIQ